MAATPPYNPLGTNKVNQGGYSGPKTVTTITPATVAPKPTTLPQASANYYYDLGGPQAGLAAPGAYARQKSDEAFGFSGLQKLNPAAQANFTPAQQDFGTARNAGIIGGAQVLQGGNAVGQGLNALGQTSAAIQPQQQALATQLTNVANGTAGPSVAELAMQRASAQAANQNLAAAAGGTGPSATAALIAAQNRNAQSQGELVQNLGIQRAIEQQQARAQLGEQLGVMRQQGGAEASTYGELGGQFGNLSGQSVNLGGLNANIGQMTGQQALANAQLQQQQNALNQQGEQYYYGQGADWMRAQAALNAQYAGNWNNYTVGQQSNANQAQIAQQQHNDALTGAIASGAAALGAGGLTLITGGAAAPLAVGATANAINQAQKASDIRGKTRIAPADAEVSRAFEPLSSSSYFYKNPNAPGAAPGQQYGPMAQELEQTPAGRTAVTRTPDGKKGIDTGRLSLLNASATGRLQRKVDAIESALKTPTVYPTVQQPAYPYGY